MKAYKLNIVITGHYKSIGKYRKKFINDVLYRNSGFLMFNAAINSLVGFVFWILCARLYSTHNVGVATTLISALSLVSTMSLLGFNSSLIRYMHKNNIAEKRINTTLVLIGTISFLLASFYILGLSLFSPKLLFLHSNIILMIYFIFAAVAVSCNTIFDSLFVAFQRADLIFIKSLFSSATKLVLPAMLISLGISGIFFANTFAVIISVLLSVFFVVNKLKLELRLSFSKKIALEMGKFSIANYISSFVENISSATLPLIITNSINPSASGYFYIGMMVASSLYIIPIAVGQVVFAQGSVSSAELTILMKKAIKLIGIILIPAIVVIILIGKLILNVFGSKYAENGYTTLVLLSIAGLPIAVKLMANTILNIEQKVGYMILINVLTVVTVIALAFILLSMGIVGVGIAWLVGESLGAIIAMICVYLKSDLFKIPIQVSVEEKASYHQQ